LRPDETADPDTFAAAVVAAVRAAGVADRVSVQSFDWRTLRAVQRMAPNLPTVCLTVQSGTSDTLAPVAGSPSPWLAGIDPAAHGGSVPRTVHAAGCRAWSPFWRNVTAETIQEAKALGLPVVPWTVNDAAEMDRLIGLGVDGLISDYPDRAVAAAGRAGKMLAPLVLGR
jgi:glycerophosphoryl diester phosphodiesterase